LRTIRTGFFSNSLSSIRTASISSDDISGTVRPIELKFFTIVHLVCGNNCTNFDSCHLRTIRTGFFSNSLSSIPVQLGQQAFQVMISQERLGRLSWNFSGLST